MLPRVFKDISIQSFVRIFEDYLHSALVYRGVTCGFDELETLTHVSATSPSAIELYGILIMVCCRCKCNRIDQRGPVVLPRDDASGTSAPHNGSMVQWLQYTRTDLCGVQERNIQDMKADPSRRKVIVTLPCTVFDRSEDEPFISKFRIEDKDMLDSFCVERLKRRGDEIAAHVRDTRNAFVFTPVRLAFNGEWVRSLQHLHLC